MSNEELLKLENDLNKVSLEYLNIIYQEYNSYFSNDQKNFFKNIFDSGKIVKIDENYDEYIKNKQANGEDYSSLPVAHGGRVFNDNIIHFYPNKIATSKNYNEIKNELQGVLMHELLHYFIRPYSNIYNEVITSFTTEALVDMIARDINVKYGLNKNYNSEYSSYVILMRELIQNVDNKELMFKVIFSGNIKNIYALINNDDTITENDIYFIIEPALNRTTKYDEQFRKIAQEQVPNYIESGIRYLKNWIANYSPDSKEFIDILGLHEDTKIIR